MELVPGAQDGNWPTKVKAAGDPHRSNQKLSVFWLIALEKSLWEHFMTWGRICECRIHSSCTPFVRGADAASPSVLHVTTLGAAADFCHWSCLKPWDLDGSQHLCGWKSGIEEILSLPTRIWRWKVNFVIPATFWWWIFISSHFSAETESLPLQINPLQFSKTGSLSLLPDFNTSNLSVVDLYLSPTVTPLQCRQNLNVENFLHAAFQKNRF